jgi:hypothetical protein
MRPDGTVNIETFACEEAERLKSRIAALQAENANYKRLYGERNNSLAVLAAENMELQNELSAARAELAKRFEPVAIVTSEEYGCPRVDLFQNVEDATLFFRRGELDEIDMIEPAQWHWHPATTREEGTSHE